MTFLTHIFNSSHWPAHIKARVVTITFALIGTVGWVLLVTDWQIALPLGIFYATITVNTYFSVKLFMSITPPENKLQHIMDLLLVVFYLLLVPSFPYPIAYMFFALCIFITAPIKYALLLNVIPYEHLLKRKILIDLLGTALCASVLGGALLGYPLVSAWVLAIVFLLANIYLLATRPMYKL